MISKDALSSGVYLATLKKRNGNKIPFIVKIEGEAPFFTIKVYDFHRNSFFKREEQVTLPEVLDLSFGGESELTRI